MVRGDDGVAVAEPGAKSVQMSGGQVRLLSAFSAGVREPGADVDDRHTFAAGQVVIDKLLPCLHFRRPGSERRC